MTPRNRPAGADAAPTPLPTPPPTHGPAFDYSVALVEHALAVRLEETTEARNAKRRKERARARLVKEPGGIATADALQQALYADGGEAIERAAGAAPDMRVYAARAAVRLLQLVQEFAFTSPKALTFAAEHACWQALGACLKDKAFQNGSTVFTESRSKTQGDTSVTASVGRFADLVKLAELCDKSSARSLSMALQLEERARVAQPTGPTVHPALLAGGQESSKTQSGISGSGHDHLLDPSNLPPELRALLEHEGIAVAESAPKADAPPPVEAPPVEHSPDAPPVPEQMSPAGILTPPFVRSPAHGGNFMPAGQARPMAKAEPPPDLEHRLELARQQQQLDALRTRNGR